MHRLKSAAIYLTVLTLLLLWMGDIIGKRERREIAQPFCPAIYEGITAVHSQANDRLIDAHQFEVYEAVAGFQMRIPYGVGGLSAPDFNCAMSSGHLRYRWVDGKLLPRYDQLTGKQEWRGSEVEFFSAYLKMACFPLLSVLKSSIATGNYFFRATRISFFCGL